MPGFWENGIANLKNAWAKGSLAQKILFSGLLVTVILTMVLFLYWLNRTEYGVLYAKLSEKDASRVVEYLKKQKVDYQLQDKGHSVLVPKERIYELRMELAGKDLLQGQGIGFEIFDQTQIGQTDFIQQINYQRALQGELARTITELPGVKAARVHLVLPKKTIFIEEQSPASASVLISLDRGGKLTKAQVQAIVNLIATAVEGLQKENITVADTAGHLLYRPTEEGALLGLTNNQLEYRINLEKGLEKRIERMLYPILGVNHVLAKVNVELDFSKKTIHKELYDPDVSVVRSEQKTTETSKGTSNVETGSPGPAYVGTKGGTGTSQESSRTEKTTNFEINKEERQIVVPEGELKRLTAAVIVDGQYVLDKDGKRVFKPRSAKELAQIKELVMNAMGYDSARGDSIAVDCMPFAQPEALPRPSIWQVAAHYGQRFAKPVFNGLLVLLFLLMVVRPVVLAIISPQVSEEEVIGTEGLPPGAEAMALEEAEPEEVRMAKEAKKHFDELKAQSKEIIEQHMEEALDIFKQWLQENAEA